MNVFQWISFMLLLFSYGDAGDISTNETVLVSDTGNVATNESTYVPDTGHDTTNVTTYLTGSPCLTAPRDPFSGRQTHFRGFCYWHSNYTYMNWYEGYVNCRITGSHLASIHSLEELNFLRGLVEGYTDIFWIGLKSKGLFTSFQWSDGTPVDYVNWEDGDSGEARNRINMCVTLNPTNGFFIRTECRERHLYICKVRDESVVSSTVTSTLPSTTTILPEVCPDGWRVFGDKCYSAFGLADSIIETWPDANQKCLDMGATLVSIHNQDEQEFLFRMMTEKTDTSWIGFREEPSSTDRAFHWSDDSAVDFTYWDENQPNNWNNYKEECGNMRFNSPHLGRWNDAKCDFKQSYICQVHIDPKKAKFIQDTDICITPKGWLRLDSSCYKIFFGTGNNMTWREAQYFCTNFGGNLVTVRNLKDSTFLRYHLEDLQGEFWIGLRNERRNTPYSWITDRMQFSHWDSGQPYEFSNQPNCVAMNPNGTWVVRRCDENRPFICETDEVTPTPAAEQPTEGMICPNNSRKWQDLGTSSCYIIELKDRVAWSEAAHRCFQQGGFLASFHSIEEVNAVLNHTKDQKDPLHIGLGQTRDGDFVWDDRSVVDFANWHEGQPSSSTQMCVEMLSASGEWNDISCEIPRGYICSVPKIFYNASVTTSVEKVTHSVDVSPIGVGSIIGIVSIFVISLIISVAAYRFLSQSKRHVRSISQDGLCDADI